MFTHTPGPVPTSPGPGSPAVSASPVAASPASPTSRTSRLRSLNILRSYTQSHLLSRDHHSHNNNNNNNNSRPSSSAASPSARPSVLRASSYPVTSSSTSTTDTGSYSASFVNNGNNAPSLPSPSVPVSTSTHPLASSISSASATQHLTPPRRSTDSSSVAPPLLAPVNANGTTTRGPSSLHPSTESGSSDTMTRQRSATASESNGANGQPLDFLPSLRFSTFYDPRATRPSLTFTPISRTLPTGGEVIRVGRYSERDNAANIPVNVPSAAPVGFKSKVVSRRHCEFWYESGKWFIRDVKSSSGTFLNHIRLSPPGTESKPFPINDGDIVQLGIDFKGGEEMIFRCVKMRIELNRGWQSKLNTFNMNTHKRLRNMTNSSGNNAAGQTYSQDCSICLNSIAPCQCLFVAPCSHTWHYKCIRALLAGPNYPIFMCPNCRAAADLEAEVEDPEEWQQLESDEGDQQNQGDGAQSRESVDGAAAPRKSRESARSLRLQRAPSTRSDVPPVPTLGIEGDEVMLDSAPEIEAESESPDVEESNGTLTARNHAVAPNATSTPVPIPSSAGAAHRASDDGSSLSESTPDGGVRSARTPSPNGVPTNGHEGPITPRNDAGPWVFDGSGVRVSGDGGARVGSLEAAVAAAPVAQVDGMDIS